MLTPRVNEQVLTPRISEVNFRKFTCNQCVRKCERYLKDPTFIENIWATCSVRKWLPPANGFECLTILDMPLQQVFQDSITRARFEGFMPHYGPMHHYRSLWRSLHLRALTSHNPDTVWIEAFTARVGCTACKTHWGRVLQETPPDFEKYFEWTVVAHNSINRALGKLQVPLEVARSYWENELVLEGDVR